MNSLIFITLAGFHILTDAFQFTALKNPQRGFRHRDIRLQAEKFDVAVLGSGPAGTAIAFLLQEQHKCNVVMIDPRGNSEKTWYPNYGEWTDEWHHLAESLKLPELKECTTTEWDITDCFFGGNGDVPMEERMTLQRGYVRVDRIKLQKIMRQKYQKANGRIIESKVLVSRIGLNLFDKNIIHGDKTTVLTLDNGQSIESKVVIDATGFETRFTANEEPYTARGKNVELKTGFQIAYGFIATVTSMGPYNFKAMTLFDYRTDHLVVNSTDLMDAENRPTFMYVMPLGKSDDGTYRVFFEETSLVGLGKRRLSFEECKTRAMQRLAFHKINILDIEEEEYCYIPMGGELPDSRQRIVPLGAAAKMVHPATGYQVCRMLAAATAMATAIGNGIQQQSSPDSIAAAAYSSIWSPENRLQRDFQAYGGDFLMQQDVKKLRGFFTAFFSLDQPTWSGFLASWPGLPNNELHDRWDRRLIFAFNLFVRMPADVAIAMVLYAISYTLEYGPNTLLRSLLPPFLLGTGPLDPRERLELLLKGNDGSIEAKEEAKRMMAAFHAAQERMEDRKAIEDTQGEAEKYLVFPAPFDA